MFNDHAHLDTTYVTTGPPATCTQVVHHGLNLWQSYLSITGHVRQAVVGHLALVIMLAVALLALGLVNRRPYGGAHRVH